MPIRLHFRPKDSDDSLFSHREVLKPKTYTSREPCSRQTILVIAGLLLLLVAVVVVPTTIILTLRADETSKSETIVIGLFCKSKSILSFIQKIILEYIRIQIKEVFYTTYVI